MEEGCLLAERSDTMRNREIDCRFDKFKVPTKRRWVRLQPEVKPPSAVDMKSTAKSYSSSNIHSILNPSQPTTSGGAPQQEGDLYHHCRPPFFEPPQADWEGSLPGQAQTGILNHGPSQKSCPQATALHAASLGPSSSSSGPVFWFDIELRETAAQRRGCNTIPAESKREAEENTKHCQTRIKGS